MDIVSPSEYITNIIVIVGFLASAIFFFPLFLQGERADESKALRPLLLLDKRPKSEEKRTVIRAIARRFL
jgi:hypothetical protein